MPQRAWSNKRERQYVRVKEGLEDRGGDEESRKKNVHGRSSMNKAQLAPAVGRG